MPDKTKLVSKLTKAHDMFGKGKDIYSRLAYVKKISELDPKDAKAINKFVGLADKDSIKLRKIMDKREAVVLAAVSAPFAPVEHNVGEKRIIVLKMFHKHGPQSKQSMKALNDCVKAMERYDVALRERLGYCDVLAKHCTAQKKVHLAIEKHMIKTEKILDALSKLPSYDSGSVAEYKFTIVRYDFVKYSAARIAKGYEKLGKTAIAHKRDIESLRKDNSAWIKDIRKKQLDDLIQKGKEFLGLAA